MFEFPNPFRCIPTPEPISPIDPKHNIYYRTSKQLENHLKNNDE